MILDKALELADYGVAITASAASTNYITFPAATRENSKVRQTYLAIIMKADGTGAGTIDFGLEDDSDSGFATTLRTVASSGAKVGTDLDKGDMILIPIPPDFQKYWRGYWTVAATVGAQFWAGLVHIV